MNCGSSCQFTCPICLQMFLTPCPTSCGHMFCYRCIDESVIRRSSCPSCRSNIRNEQFVQSKPFSKMSDFFWSTSKEKQSYSDKRFRNEEWMKGRKIDISNVKIEDFIDARDTEFIWCPAKIMNIFNTNGKIQFLVHFLGWNQIYDQIIISTSQRLAPFKFFSERDDIPKYRVNVDENNMRSRIDYPTSGDDESDSNNHVMVFGNRENFRRNHFQLMNPSRRPMIQQLIARRRSFVPEFSLFNGVQNLFINLRPHRDESSSSNNVGEENINESSQRLNEDERANEENEGVEEQQEAHIQLDEQSREGIHEVENFQIQIGPNINDSLNIPASNYYQLDEESVSNQLVVINPSNIVNQSDNYEIRRQDRSSSELQIIQVYQQQNNFRNLEVNQQRQTQNRLQLEPSSQSSSSYSFGCAPGEQ